MIDQRLFMSSVLLLGITIFATGAKAATFDNAPAAKVHELAGK